MADETSEEAKGLIAQLARSGRMRIAAALVVVALVGGGLGVLMLQGGAASKKLLFSGLDLEEAAAIIQKLDTANDAKSLESGGSSDFVDAATVEDARMMLSEQGLPTRGSVGWEIFDKSDALGETQFVLNIKKLRAMEGELERSIASYDLVQSAKVHLSIPEKPLFQSNTDRPKAAVVLKLAGNMMPAEKVRAIRNLVASQVPGLDVNAVTVTSTDGRLLAAASEDGSTGMGGGAGTDERRSAMEEAYRKKVLDVIENIELPCLIGPHPLPAAEARARAMALVGRVGLASVASHRPDQLSGGQRQRVAIARALVMQPALVLADEPTANLDSVTSQQIIDLMLTLNRDDGVTFLFSTHDHRVEQHARRVVAISDGQLTESKRAAA